MTATCGWPCATAAFRRCSTCRTRWSPPAPRSRTRSAISSSAANTARSRMSTGVVADPRRSGPRLSAALHGTHPRQWPHDLGRRLAPAARAAGSRSIPTSPRSSGRRSCCAPAPRNCPTRCWPMPTAGAGQPRSWPRPTPQLEEAKRELTEMEARTRLTTEMMPAHIAHVDRDLRYTFSNRRLSSVMPGGRRNIVGLTLGTRRWARTPSRGSSPMLDRALAGEASVSRVHRRPPRPPHPHRLHPRPRPRMARSRRLPPVDRRDRGSAGPRGAGPDRASANWRRN